MKKLILSVMLVLGMAASSWATVYDLNHTNLTLTGDLASYTGNFATADITGSTVTFSGTTGVSLGGHIYDFFLLGAGINTSNAPTIVTITTTPAKNYEQGGTGNIDGFGTFNLQVQPTGSQGAPSAVETIAFTLSADPVLQLNNQGYNVAAHMIIFKDGLTTGITGDITTGGTPVPEPGTMMLLGMGMLGLAVYGKRRMNKEA